MPLIDCVVISEDVWMADCEGCGARGDYSNSICHLQQVYAQSVSLHLSYYYTFCIQNLLRISRLIC